MAPKYKLTYFNGTGRAEPIRYLFAYAGQDYVDYRMKREEWPQLKANTPYGKVPVLEVDGKPVAQTNAIARYLAKQFKLQGSDDWEILQADSLVEALGDYNSSSMRLFREENPERIAEIKKEQAFYLAKFEKILSSSPSGLLVGPAVTWADLVFAATLSSRPDQVDALKSYPALSVFVNKINNLPNIKKWVETRPKSDPPPKGPHHKR
nr:glutathione S-transferase [Dendroctonus rhizophagus]